MVGIIRAEWLKMTRQNASRIILGLMAALAAVFTIVEISNVLGTSPALRQADYNGLNFPDGFYLGIKDLVGYIGVIMVIVLTANVIGGEYSLDTWKNLLTRHQGRGRFLTAKILVATAALLIVFLATGVIMQLFSFVGHAIVAGQASTDGLTITNMSANSFFTGLYTNGLPLLLYFAVLGVATIMVTVLSRSTVAGIVVPLVLWMGDQFSLRLLGPSNALTNLTLTKNLNSLQDNLAKSGSGSMEIWQSLVIMGAYIVIGLVISLVVFRRRDMAG